MLDKSLVFMITVGSGYETVLKDPTWFFFKILFSFFQDLGRVSKICKKNKIPGFQSTSSPTCDTSQLSKPVFHIPVIRNFIISKK